MLHRSCRFIENIERGSPRRDDHTERADARRDRRAAPYSVARSFVLQLLHLPPISSPHGRGPHYTNWCIVLHYVYCQTLQANRLLTSENCPSTFGSQHYLYECRLCFIPPILSRSTIVAPNSVLVSATRPTSNTCLVCLASTT